MAVVNWTPLSRAICSQNEDVALYLLTKKIVVDTLNIVAFKDASTPLHIACRSDTLEMVRRLLKHGSNINYPRFLEYGTP